MDFPVPSLHPEFAPPDDLDPELPPGGLGLGQPGDGIMIGDGNRGEFQRGGLADKLARGIRSVGRRCVGMQIDKTRLHAFSSSPLAETGGLSSAAEGVTLYDTLSTPRQGDASWP